MITTTRTYLLPMEVKHFDSYLQSRSALSELTGLSIPDAFPWSESEEHFPWFREQLLKNPAITPWAMNMIVQIADQTVIGEIGSGSGPDEKGWVIFGYHIIPSYRRQGYATEAAKGFVEFAIKQQGVIGIRAETLKDGFGSIRVLEKNGFQQVKETKDTLVWERSA